MFQRAGMRKGDYLTFSGSGFPPFIIPTLRNIGILHYKQTKLPKHLQHSVSSSFSLVARWHNIFFPQFTLTFVMLSQTSHKTFKMGWNSL